MRTRTRMRMCKKRMIQIAQGVQGNQEIQGVQGNQEIQGFLEGQEGPLMGPNLWC